MSKSEQPDQVEAIIDLAIAEDLGKGDITTSILIPPELTGRAIILVKAAGVLAGAEIARRVFLKIDPELKVDLLISDGAPVKPGDKIAVIAGRSARILQAERTALNFLQRLSGIASLTARYVAEVSGLGVEMTDTRKTAPGLRLLDKYAVRMGGGKNHRLHLGDGILIKDNHIAALRASGMGLKDIVGRAKRAAPQGIRLEVEVTTPEEAAEAVAAGAGLILLDNMPLEDMRRVRVMVGRGVKLEASGGINLDNVRAVAETGVDYISVGALTHSVKALDISLEIEPESRRL